MRYDVAVVGGGPAGSAAATICAQHGSSVILFERHERPRHRPGESLAPGAETLFRILGIERDVWDADFPRHAGLWLERDGRLRYQPFGADRRGPWLGFQALRSRLDRLLLAGAVRAGSVAALGEAADDFSYRGNDVAGVVTNLRRIEARFVIDAAGDGRWAARRLGITTLRCSRPLVARYGYARGTCSARDEAPIFRMDDDGWSWLSRIGRDVYGWCSVSLGGTTTTEIPELRVLRSLGRPRGADVTWRILKQVSGVGWFVAGDAAAVCDPSAGQGVLRSIVSGMIAGHLIVRVLSGHLSELAAARYYDDWLRSRFALLIQSFIVAGRPPYRIESPYFDNTASVAMVEPDCDQPNLSLS
jgi:flavin-dependent dehydrogenase